MADRPLTLRRLLASHRDHRANLLGGVCRRRARARRIDEPLGHGLGGRRLPPPPAPESRLPLGGTSHIGRIAVIGGGTWARPAPMKLRHQWEELPMTTVPRLSILTSTML